MLDTDTKRRIDTARDILVGKLPDPKSQVEQITIALIYKFMDDMDKESEAMGGKPSFFTGEFSRYSWSNIFDPRLGGFEIFGLYTEAIQRMNQNKNIPQLFRDIFKNAYLPYRDPETLKGFLKVINDFHYDHSEKLGDAFEYLLSIMGSQGDAGQFRTPRHIIDFIVEVVEPKKNETILDPSCGTAGFLISSYKHILKENIKNGKVSLTPDEKKRLIYNFVGYDISPDMVRLSLVNMYLHGFKNPHIFEYDTLTSEERWNDVFDVIMTNPPFMTPKGGIKPHKRFSIQANRSEVLFVDYIAEHLNPNGRAGIIVPEGIIFQSANAYKALRKMLLKSYLWAVVSLPAGVFNPYSGVKTSILLLDKNIVKRTNDILFIKIENDGFGLGAQRREINQNDLPAALNLTKRYKTALLKGDSCELTDHEHKYANIVSKEKIGKNGDYNLSSDRYIETIVHKKQKWDMVELEEICEFKNGLWAGKKEPYVNIKILRNTNFTKDGRLSIEDVAEINVAVNQLESRKLIKYDILLERSGGGPKQPVGRVAFFNLDGEYSFSNFTTLIRVKDNAHLEPSYLWRILNYLYSMGYTEKLQKQTHGIRNLEFDRYKKIKIPLPPLSIQKEIVSEIEGYQKIIDGAKQIVENYKPIIKIDPEWEMVELSTICGNLDSKRKPVSVAERKKGIYPYYGASGIVDYVEDYIFNEDLLLVSEDGANLRARVTPIAFSISGKTWVNNHAHVLKFNDKITQLFVEIYLNSINLEKYVTGSAQPKLNQDRLNIILIPLPPLEVQQQIISQIEEEQKIVEANKKLIEIFEKKIKNKIAEVWSEENE